MENVMIKRGSTEGNDEINNHQSTSNILIGLLKLQKSLRTSGDSMS